jgi:hypothetical protein
MVVRKQTHCHGGLFQAQSKLLPINPARHGSCIVTPSYTNGGGMNQWRRHRTNMEAV